MQCGHSLCSEVFQLFFTVTRFAPDWLHLRDLSLKKLPNGLEEKPAVYIKQLSEVAK